MNVAERIFIALREARGAPCIAEGPDGQAVTAGELLHMIARARAFLRRAGVRRGDRVVLVGGNSARWAALDLAVLFEGAICVPLYARQPAAAMAGLVRDSAPALLLAAEPPGAAVEAALPGGAPLASFAEALTGPETGDEPVALSPEDRVRIIYTSGTSGAPKGALLSFGNLEFMLGRTSERLDALLRGVRVRERVFHYLPCCFAGSWILLQTALLRGARLTFCTDLERLADQMRAARPHYVLHVPLVLQRLQKGIERRCGESGGLRSWIWRRPWLARRLLFPALRRALAPGLRAFICGSAPLEEETQRFFLALGLPVLQVYGLTETTAICTMDRPGRARPGWVGPAIQGCEMRLDPNGEIEVRGPNLFAGYWNRAAHAGWFRTGDLGEVDAAGNWRILGRRKSLLVLSSGHNVAPEPIERRLAAALGGALDVVLFGNGRPHLAALVAGRASAEQVAAALARINAGAPHYRRVRGYLLHETRLDAGEGLRTANGKLRRGAIEERFRKRIEELYA